MESNQQTILIVEDDKNNLELLEMYLQNAGYSYVACENGLDAVQVFRNINPALIVLDVMLPGLDGFGVLAEVRKKSDVPVIMLTAKGSSADKVMGLNLGADDYISKPYDSKELVARIQAVLRRSSSAESETEQGEIRFRDLYISMSNYYVTLGDKKLDMTPKEIELLFFLLSHAPNVFTRDQLLRNVWKTYDPNDDTRTVDVHIKRIRAKLGDEYSSYIVTVWKIGYKFDFDAPFAE